MIGTASRRVESTSTTDLVTQASAATDRALKYLLEDQADNGSWVGTLCSSCEPTALSVMALHASDKQTFANQIQRGIDWLLETQLADGGWGDAVLDPSNVKATVLAVSALRLIDHDRYHAQIVRGLCRLEQLGGWPAVSIICAPIAALAGLLPWESTANLPIELILFPSGLRRRTSFGLSGFLSIGLMQNHRSPPSPWRRMLQRIARPRVIRWLREVQGTNGAFGESAMLNAFVVIGLIAAGERNGSGADVIHAALQYLVAQQRHDGSWPLDRDLEVFITTNAIIALAELKHELGQPRFVRTRDWLLEAQTKRPCFATGAPLGGWAWAVPSGWPDSDDTGFALKALSALGLSASDRSMQAGIDWILHMQNRDGSWSTFVPNSSAPFDQPCPYVTAHVLSGLRATGKFGMQSRPVQRAFAWLREVQGEDGTFQSIWFRNYSCGTAAVLEALADYDQVESSIGRRCIQWLLANQNRDGSWGGGLEQPGTAEETAWAIGALLSANVSPQSAAIERGIAWLLAQQRPDGSWDAAIIGLYSRSLYYSNTHYPLTFALKALAVYSRRAQAMAEPPRVRAESRGPR